MVTKANNKMSANLVVQIGNQVLLWFNIESNIDGGEKQQLKDFVPTNIGFAKGKEAINKNTK